MPLPTALQHIVSESNLLLLCASIVIRGSSSKAACEAAAVVAGHGWWRGYFLLSRTAGVICTTLQVRLQLILYIFPLSAIKVHSQSCPNQPDDELMHSIGMLRISGFSAGSPHQRSGIRNNRGALRYRLSRQNSDAQHWDSHRASSILRPTEALSEGQDEDGTLAIEFFANYLDRMCARRLDFHEVNQDHGTALCVLCVWIRIELFEMIPTQVRDL